MSSLERRGSRRPWWRRWLGSFHSFGERKSERHGPPPPVIEAFTIYTVSQVKAATRNFTVGKLGEGGFGIVYKGQINGKDVAVKKIPLNNSDDNHMRDIRMEIDVMRVVRHVNVVEMLGLCQEREELYIVSDLMPNGDLEDRLGGLSWEQRFAIGRDIASGLDYLHNGANRARIVHRDIKGKNILLDHDFRARIADFGLTRLVDPDVGEADTMRMQGTLGYAPPDSEITPKWDVFSFGVVLLQLLSGQQALSEELYRKRDQRAYLFRRVLMDCRSGVQFLQFLDPRVPMITKEHLDSAKRMFRVALLCLQQYPQHRPDMRDVVKYLVDEQPALPPMKSWLRIPDVNPLECDSQTLMSELKVLAKQLKAGPEPWDALAVLSTRSPTSTSDVVLAKMEPENARELPLYFCVKTMDADPMSERGRDLHRRVGSRGYHPNVVHYLAGKDPPQQPKMLQVCMEYVGDSVRSRIDRQRRPLDEQDVIRYTRNLLTGLQHVHAGGVIHMGVKCENMLIMDGTADCIKLGGFGSAILDRTHRSTAEANPAMFRWNPDGCFDPRAAPDVSSGSSAITRDADIWSVGIAVHEMLTGRVPYGDQVKKRRNDDTVFIPPPQIESEKLSPLADKFIRRCLRKVKTDPMPTIAGLLEDPFLQLPTP